MWAFSWESIQELRGNFVFSINVNWPLGSLRVYPHWASSGSIKSVPLNTLDPLCTWWCSSDVWKWVWDRFSCVTMHSNGILLLPLPLTLLLDAQCGYIALELVHTVVATTEFSFFDVIMKWDLYLIAGSLEAAYSLNWKRFGERVEGRPWPTLYKPCANLVPTLCKPCANLMPTSCKPHANLVPTSCQPCANLMQTWCKPHANLVPTLCKPHTNLVQTSCQPHANLVLTSCKPHVNLMLTSCQPHANLAQTSYKPHANLMPTSCQPHANLLPTSCQPCANLMQTSCQPCANLVPTSC